MSSAAAISLAADSLATKALAKHQDANLINKTNNNSIAGEHRRQAMIIIEDLRIEYTRR